MEDVYLKIDNIIDCQGHYSGFQKSGEKPKKKGGRQGLPGRTPEVAERRL